MNVSGLGFGCWVGENRASRTRAGQRSVGRSLTHRHSSGRAHIQRFMDGRASSRWIRAKRPAVACWSRREGAATRQCIPPCPWGGPLRCMSSATTSVGVLQKWRIERHRAPLHLCVSVVWCRWSVSGVHNVRLSWALHTGRASPDTDPQEGLAAGTAQTVVALVECTPFRSAHPCTSSRRQAPKSKVRLKPSHHREAGGGTTLTPATAK